MEILHQKRLIKEPKIRGRPNTYNQEYMSMVAKKVVEGELTYREAGKTFGVSSGSISSWVRQFKKGSWPQASKVREATEKVKVIKLESHVRELKQEIGELYLENLMLKKHFNFLLIRWHVICWFITIYKGVSMNIKCLTNHRLTILFTMFVSFNTFAQAHSEIKGLNAVKTEAAVEASDQRSVASTTRSSIDQYSFVNTSEEDKTNVRSSIEYMLRVCEGIRVSLSKNLSYQAGLAVGDTIKSIHFGWFAKFIDTSRSGFSRGVILTSSSGKQFEFFERDFKTDENCIENFFNDKVLQPMFGPLK